MIVISLRSPVQVDFLFFFLPGSVVLAQRPSEESLVDRAKPLPTSLQSDFIPDDVLLALTQPPYPREQLGPPSRHKTLAAVSMFKTD